MTLKEIEKIIDEADFTMYGHQRDRDQELDGHWYPMDANCKKYEKEEYRHANDLNYPQAFMDGDVKCYYKFNKMTGEMTLLAKVDHVDKEKKIIKKKLDDMTDEEIENFKKRVCCKHWECFDCPFYNGETREDYSPCYEAFIYYRSGYLKYKNREIEIEVEE